MAQGEDERPCSLEVEWLKKEGTQKRPKEPWEDEAKKAEYDASE